MFTNMAGAHKPQRMRADTEVDGARAQAEVSPYNLRILFLVGTQK